MTYTTTIIVIIIIIVYNFPQFHPQYQDPTLVDSQVRPQLHVRPFPSGDVYYLTKTYFIKLVRVDNVMITKFMFSQCIYFDIFAQT